MKKPRKFSLLLACCVLTLLVMPTQLLAHWDEGQPYKWYQRPDVDPVGSPPAVMGIDICVDNTPEFGQRTIGDDFECSDSDPITGVHIFGSWEKDFIEANNAGTIRRVHIRFYTDNPMGGYNPPPNEYFFSTPDQLVYDEWFDASRFSVRKYWDIVQPFYEWWWDPGTAGSLNPMGDQRVWQINVNLTDKPFNQEGSPDQPIIYWLVVQVELDAELSQGKSFGWKTRDRNKNVEGGGQFMDAAVWGAAASWHDIEYPNGHPYAPDRVDMAFVLTTGDNQGDFRDYGDAPEGGIAYPSSGVIGNFPTCRTVGPAGWVQHNNFGAWFGAFVDFEYDGNAGACPACFPPYDQDECFDPTNSSNNSDPGLMFPDAYTIDTTNTVVLCPAVTSGQPALGQTCATAVWGRDIDIWVHNTMPNHEPYLVAYVNVLIDWNQDGIWGGFASGPGCSNIPEHVLVDHPVDPLYIGPLSGVSTPVPNFQIGPNAGYVWARIMISEAQVGRDWNGEGSFEDGESEDYLLMIDPKPDDELDFGDAPEYWPDGTATAYPTTLANNGARHIITPNGPFFDDTAAVGADFPDAELDGQPTTPADGDDVLDGNDDEDGVIIPPLIQGQNATITFTVGGPGGGVEGFIDWNADGDWADPGEALPPASYPPGPASMTVSVPAAAVVGPTYARFRISSTAAALMGYAGLAPDGEVEDYEVFIEPGEEPDEKLKFQQLPLDGLQLGDNTYWGHDELSTVYPRYNDPIGPDDPRFVEQYIGCYMADDFADYEHSPVIRVKWWGSYLGEREEPGMPFMPQPVNRFVIAFESDMPAQGEPGQPDYIPSHPDVLLQHEVVDRAPAGTIPAPGMFTEKHVSFGGPACFEDLFEYEAILANPFPQDPNTVYWIKIVAVVELPPDHPFWKDISAAQDMCDFLQYHYNPYQYDAPVTRWGWHNRDYTIRDPYACKPPDVIPGERTVGMLLPGTSMERKVWHFQDDCVSGDVMMPVKPVPYPEIPYIEFVEQAKMPHEYQPDRRYRQTGHGETSSTNTPCPTAANP